jgi:hypothetical protein
LNALSRGLQFLKQGGDSSNNSHDTSATLPKDAGQDTYGCEVFTFGRAHHCASNPSYTGSDGARSRVRLWFGKGWAVGNGRRGPLSAADAGADHCLLVYQDD